MSTKYSTGLCEGDYHLAESEVRHGYCADKGIHCQDGLHVSGRGYVRAGSCDPSMLGRRGTNGEQEKDRGQYMMYYYTLSYVSCHSSH